jgi:hypothetical protein
MTGRIRYLLAAAALFAAAAASAQPPQPPTLAELDKLAADALREVHNRGAELYNRGDPAGCYRMYEGAIIAIRPFLAHRPAAVKALDDGLAEVSRSSDGVKVQAFRLHELIEQVRTDLKAGAKQAAPKPTDPAANPPAGTTAGLKGVVTLNGAALDAGEVTFVTLDLPRPRVFTAKVKGGAYAFADPLPVGKYVVIVTGKGVPEKFQTTLTSGIRAEVAGGPNNFDLDLKSK